MLIRIVGERDVGMSGGVLTGWEKEEKGETLYIEHEMRWFHAVFVVLTLVL